MESQISEQKGANGMAYEKENVEKFARMEVRTLKFIVNRSHPVVGRARTPNTKVVSPEKLAKRQAIMARVRENEKYYAQRELRLGSEL